MGKFAQGVYKIKNPLKYIGKKSPIYRSSWEHTFMLFLDNHTSILNWASEPMPISYKDPITGKNKNYWPDFLIIYVDAAGKKVAEMIEIKPASQSNTLAPGKKRTKSSRLLEATIARNHAKWASAKAWCAHNGINFRVVTENTLFGK
jgi:hypothetical protein